MNGYSLFVFLFTLTAWYSSGFATELTYSDQKDLADSITRNCLKTQKANPINSAVPIWKMEEYCACYGTALSMQFTSDDVIRFLNGGGFRPGMKELARDLGNTCLNQLIIRWNQ